jgi:tetratricopeptide (TPR) repeat protein
MAPNQPDIPAPPLPDAETLSFACEHCRTPLAVPVSMAGVTGPCPGCQQLITAPLARPMSSPLAWNPFNAGRLPQSLPPVTPPETIPLAPPIPPVQNAQSVIPDMVPPRQSAYAGPTEVPPMAAPTFSSTPFPPTLGPSGGAGPVELPSHFGPPKITPEVTESNTDSAASVSEIVIEPMQYDAAQPPLVLPKKRRRRVLPSWLPAVATVVLLIGLGWGGWLAAWQSGHAPKPSIAVLREFWNHLWNRSEKPESTVMRIENAAWNLSLELPRNEWTELHPGGSNFLCSAANLQDPECRVVMNVGVQGTVPKELASLVAKDGETLAQKMLGEHFADLASKQGLLVEERLIGGKKFRYFRQEESKSKRYFRPHPVATCVYLYFENNSSYFIVFTGHGAKAFEKLPTIAEGILATLKPIVGAVEFATLNNLTTSDPRLLKGETGLEFPPPDAAWSIIPDEPTTFSMLRYNGGQNRAFVGGQKARDGSVALAAGSLGAPSVGYQTPEGDLAGASVFHLPADLNVELRDLADIILNAWFPDTSFDRETERPFVTGETRGIEIVGQASHDLVPAPYAFRIARRGDYIYATGACSFSQQRNQAALVQLLNQVSWGQAIVPTELLGERYTPAACVPLWEHVILTLGKEKQAANQLGEAVRLYEQAFEMMASGPILLALCESYAQLNQLDKGLTLLESEWRNQARQAKFLAGAAQFMAQHKRIESATKLFTTALQFSMDNTDALTMEIVERYLKTLHEVKAHDEALRVLDVLASAAPSNLWKLWEAHILSNRTETRSRGVEIMEGLVASVRKNRSLAQEIIYFLKQQKAHQLGLEGASGVLRLNPHDAMAWMLRATCERELGDEKRAAATLAQAREYNPELRDLQDLVYAITDEEGGPVLNEHGPQAEAIPLPAELNKLVRAQMEAGPQADAEDYEYLYRVRSLTYDPGSPFRTTNRYAIRIANARGMEEFNILKFSYHPRGERIQVNELRVRTPDGKVISPNGMKDAFITEDNADGIQTGMKLFNLPVPGLSPGCILEYTVTEESLGILAGPLTSTFHFATETPCGLDILYIYSPVAKVDFRHSTGDKPIKLATGLVWMERNLPGLVTESHQPSLEKFVPVLWTGDGSENWARLGASYLSLIQSKMKSDEAVVRMARDKTKHCRTDQEKIAVLSKYVRDNISYAAIEFGMRGLVPNTAMETVKNRYGDCKDHSVLLYQLLRGVGINAKLVLANAQMAVQPDLPSLGAFNHMITAIPGKERGEWDFIDCTNKMMAPAPDVPPWMLAGKQVLVLGEGTTEFSPDASKLVKVKSYPDNFENVSVERSVQVIESQHLAVQETITLSGLAALDLRYQLTQGDHRRDISVALKHDLGMDRSRFQVKLAKADHLQELEKPLVLHLEYEIRNAVNTSGQRVLVRLPNLAELRFLDPDNTGQTRRTPFEFSGSLTFTSRTKLYGAISSLAAPQEPVQKNSKFIDWSAEQKNLDGRAEVMLQVTRKSGSHPATDYAAFQSEISQAAQSVEEISLIPGPARPVPVATQR